MSIPSRLLAALAVAILVASAHAQNSAPSIETMESEVAGIRAENEALREQLRSIQEQQKVMVSLINQLQRRLDGTTAATTVEAQPSRPVIASPAQFSRSIPAFSLLDVARQAPVPSAFEAGTVAAAMPGSVPTPAQPTQPSALVAADQDKDSLYQDGIVIQQTSDDARIPFLLKLNNNTQIRYLNSLSSDATFTDHLGGVREVNRRNDITVNRSMFILGGYIFDKRARYSLTVWTSAGAASIIVAGNIGWQFNKAFTLTGGYTGVPGSRSLVNTFPFFTASDRSMADNFFRPGFTQGVWGSGEPVKNLNYLLFVGNGLNTLNISATKIDENLMFSGSVWWEPLGAYSEPGKSRHMYDDYFASRKTRIRIGGAFTRSREDRFSNLDQTTPDNTAMYNSDGVLTFSTGAFAPGVTVNKATYRMGAIDGGIKWNGLAVNGQYFLRSLTDFLADGPLPLTSTFDHGFELSSSYFVVPKKVLAFVRGSHVFGQFGNSWEYAGGVKWHFLRTERLWLQAELMRVHKAPYTGAFTPYTAGLNGWVPMIQSVIAF